MIKVREVENERDENSKVLEFYSTDKIRINGYTKLKLLRILEEETKEFRILCQLDDSIFRVRVFTK